MKETIFISKYQQEWAELEAYLAFQSLPKRKRTVENTPTLVDDDFPKCYRRVCNQLALAQTRNFSQYTIERLNDVVVKGHLRLYKRRGFEVAKVYQFFLTTFPCAMRREKVVMLWALAIFVIPAIVVQLLVIYSPSLVFSVLDPSLVSDMESMYEPSEQVRVGESRDSSSDVKMFGHYIMNNITIGLRSFASGLILGLGSIFICLFNGVYLGAIFGHLTNAGYATKTLYPFVITHGAFEITAIIISSGAGIRLGLSVLFPNRLSRMASLQKTVQNLMPIVIGFTLMLLLAAFIEAFWSSIQMDSMIKYISGSICWVLVIYYFLFVGKARGSQ